MAIEENILYFFRCFLKYLGLKLYNIRNFPLKIYSQKRERSKGVKEEGGKERRKERGRKVMREDGKKEKKD